MEENGAYAEATSSEWGNWSSMLQNVTQFGLQRWIDSEIRDDQVSGLPYIIGTNGQVIPVATSTATTSSGSAFKLLMLGGLVLAAVLLLRRV